MVLQLVHRPSGLVIAEGPPGLRGILSFEGNYYIARACLRAGRFRFSGMPGLCVYKFVYLWMHLELPGGHREANFGWMYVLPNPLFFWLAFRVGISQRHPALVVRLVEGVTPERENGAAEDAANT